MKDLKWGSAFSRVFFQIQEVDGKYEVENHDCCLLAGVFWCLHPTLGAIYWWHQTLPRKLAFSRQIQLSGMKQNQQCFLVI